MQVSIRMTEMALYLVLFCDQSISTNCIILNYILIYKYIFQVYVWGLNDKDQLAGVKGSKVKVPVYSPVLSALRPVHIAGGSKTLFIVSYDGKVTYRL